MDYIYHQYISKLAPRLRNFKKQSRNKYNFSCPFCGDSKTNKLKARGFLLEKQNEVFYYCHNDSSCNASFSYFLYRLDPNLLNQFNLEKFQSKYQKPVKEETLDIIKTLKDHLHIGSVKGPITTATQESFSIELPTISELDDNHPAKKYIKTRLIPKEYHNDLFFSRYWMKFVNDVKIKHKQPPLYQEKQLHYDHPRLVIPLRNKDGIIFAFQGRAFHKDTLRYITIRLDEEELKIYGQDKVNDQDLVFILEGPIDSMFITNSIGLAGSDVDLNRCPFPNNRVFLLDNEPRNTAIVKKYKKLIASGEKIVSWLNCPWEGKDINDILMNTDCTIEQINEYVRNNIVSGLEATMLLNQWKRCNV